MVAKQFHCLNWSVKCKDSQNHKKLCKLKMIKCSIDGCNHKCRRKDMNKHLSGYDRFLRHIYL